VVVQNMSVPQDRRVWQECRALRAAGYRVSVVCPRGLDQPVRQTLEEIDILTYVPPPPTSGVASYLVEFVYCWVRTLVITMRLQLTARIDVIQACNPPDTFFALALLHRPFGTRFVFDQHDLCPEVYASRFGGGGQWCRTGLQLLERATYRTADHVIVTNESYRETAFRRGGLQPASVTVVRSGPDPTTMIRRAASPHLRNGRPFLACWLGIMGPQDGVDLLLRSIELFVRDLGREDCQFALMGYGDCLDDLRALSTELDIDPWVTFTGRAGAETIATYLSTADIGLSADPLNPLNDVSTMNKTMEYMAYEVPVVAYDLKETRVSADRSALYVVPNDPLAYAKAMSDLLDNSDERAAMGAIGRKRIEGVLAWQRQVPGYVGVFDQLLAQAPHAVGRGHVAGAVAR
jgi:glycosyltransferase involved in cell wall biosynthesis